MNKERRARIAKVVSALEDAKSELENLEAEEQEAFDNMPESFQNGEKGDECQAAIDALNTAASNVEEAVSELENIA